MKHDILADMFNIIKLTEQRGAKECKFPTSKMVDGVLSIMKANGYIGEYKPTGTGNKRMVKIKLLGKINDCSVIKPRFSVKVKDMIKFEKRFLPARGIGILFLSTSKGIMDHKEAIKNKTGGLLLGYMW